MKPVFRRLIWWMLGALLLAMMAMQLPVWQGGANREILSGKRSLVKELPAELAGGTARDEPIAATEEMKQKVGELLNYDDAVYRIYQLPGARVSVYAAWWRAGKMSPRLVAAHTPDVCWPDNGWTRDRGAEGRLGALSRELGATGFAEGECRVFVANGKSEYVVFWHKVGGEMLSYKNGWAPPWWAWLDEMWRSGLNLRKEQLFVRVSSDKPLDKVWVRTELAPLRRALLELGLGANGKEQNAK